MFLQSAIVISGLQQQKTEFFFFMIVKSSSSGTFGFVKKSHFNSFISQFPASGISTNIESPFSNNNITYKMNVHYLNRKIDNQN